MTRFFNPLQFSTEADINKRQATSFRVQVEQELAAQEAQRQLEEQQRQEQEAFQRQQDAASFRQELAPIEQQHTQYQTDAADFRSQADKLIADNPWEGFDMKSLGASPAPEVGSPTNIATAPAPGGEVKLVAGRVVRQDGDTVTQLGSGKGPLESILPDAAIERLRNVPVIGESLADVTAGGTF